MIFFISFVVIGILFIVTGVQNYKKYKSINATVVQGKVIRNEEIEGIVYCKGISRCVEKVALYTPIYEYEYLGVHEVYHYLSNRKPTELGKTCNLDIYDDGSVKFKPISMCNDKIVGGIVCIVCTFAITYMLWVAS